MERDLLEDVMHRVLRNSILSEEIGDGGGGYWKKDVGARVAVV